MSDSDVPAELSIGGDSSTENNDEGEKPMKNYADDEHTNGTNDNEDNNETNKGKDAKSKQNKEDEKSQSKCCLLL